MKHMVSEFTYVADFFAQKRKMNGYEPSKQKMKHADAVLKLLAVFTGDNDYLKYQVKEEDGEISMCEVLQSYIRQGREEGIELGR